MEESSGNCPGLSRRQSGNLYDIDIEARKIFMDAGGEKYTFIPSLNDSEAWVEAIWKIMEKYSY